MYVGWLAVALGWYQLQIGMSFESDKSSSYFTQGVWRRSFNGAISRVPAGKNPGNVASFRGFLTLRTPQLEIFTGSRALSLFYGHHAGAARNFLR